MIMIIIYQENNLIDNKYFIFCEIYNNDFIRNTLGRGIRVKNN